MKRAASFLPTTRAGWLRLLVWASVAALAVAALWHKERSEYIRLKRYGCLANLRAISDACQVYAADNGGAFPDRLERLSPKYLNKPAVLKCPADKSQAASSYAIVPGLNSKMKNNCILLYDRAGGHMYVARTNGDVDGVRGNTKEDVEAEIKSEATKERGN